MNEVCCFLLMFTHTYPCYLYYPQWSSFKFWFVVAGRQICVVSAPQCLTVIASRFRVWNPARANHFLPTHTWPQQKKQLLHINDHIHNLLLFLSKLVHLPETEEKKTTNKTLVCSAWAVSDRLDFSLHNCHHLFQAHKLLVNCELTFQPQSDLQYLFSPNTKQTTHYERIKQIQFVTQMWNHKPAIIVKLSLVLYITQYSLLCERDITVTFQIQSWLNPFIRSVWQL